MEDFKYLFVFLLQNIVLIAQIVLIVLFILLYINVLKLKNRFSDKYLYKQYLVHLSMGNRAKAFEYLQKYYHSRLVDKNLSEDEERHLVGLIKGMKSDFSE